jgi:histidine triad (HIT) family protein
VSDVEASCFVCRKHRGEVDLPGGALWADDLVCATHGIVPEGKRRAYLGTLFVEPRRHLPSTAELSEPEAERIGAVASRLARALKTSERAEHVYVFGLGHHVDHLHLWLVPRYPGTPPEFWPMRLAEAPGAPLGGPADIAALCDRLRAELERDTVRR